MRNEARKPFRCAKNECKSALPMLRPSTGIDFSKRASSLVAVFFLIAVGAFSGSLLMTILPYHVVQLGGSPSDVGVVQSSVAASMAVSFCWMGPASDVLGRKPIIVGGIATVSLFFFAASMSQSLESLIFSLLGVGLFLGYSVAVQAYIGDATSRSEQPMLIARLGIVGGVVSLFSPSLASLVATSSAGYNGAFILVSLMFMVSAGGAELFLLDREQLARLNHSTHHAKARERWRKLRDLYVPSCSSMAGRAHNDERWPIILSVVGIHIFVSALGCTLHFLLPLGPLVSTELGQSWYAGLLTLDHIAAAGANVGFVWLQRVMGTFEVGLVGSVLILLSNSLWASVSLRDCRQAGSCLVANASISDLACLVSGAVLYGCGHALTMTAGSCIILQSSNSRNAGTTLTAGMIGISVGNIVGPLLFGHILQAVGTRYAFTAASAGAGIVAVLWVMIRNQDDEESTARMRKGLPSRRKFYDTVMQAVRESRDRKRDQVMQALLDEFQYIIQRRGYELAAPGAFEELARALNEAFKQRHEGRLSRVTRRISYAPQLA